MCFSLEAKRKNPREQLELNRLNKKIKIKRETRMHKNATYIEKEIREKKLT